MHTYSPVLGEQRGKRQADPGKLLAGQKPAKVVNFCFSTTLLPGNTVEKTGGASLLSLWFPYLCINTRWGMSTLNRTVLWATSHQH